MLDFKQIQELIKMVNKSNIGEVSIEQNDFKLSIKQKKDVVPQILTGAIPVAAATTQVATAPQAVTGSASVTEAPKSEEKSNLITIKSPMIGTFYRKSSPDKPNLVDEGDMVAPGKVVCIIEAMKLFNEIESEISGKVVKVLVEDSSPVEFDQPLFLVEP